MKLLKKFLFKIYIEQHTFPNEKKLLILLYSLSGTYKQNLVWKKRKALLQVGNKQRSRVRMYI
jgi:hypothetical protein